MKTRAELTGAIAAVEKETVFDQLVYLIESQRSYEVDREKLNREPTYD